MGSIEASVHRGTGEPAVIEHKRVKVIDNNLRCYVSQMLYVVPVKKELAKYEADVFSGKIPCPFKIEFKNTDGLVVSTQPIPLTPAGKPKIDLF